MYVIYFSIWEAHIDNSKSNNFDEEFIQGFLASNYAEVQSKWKLTFAKAVFYVPNNIHGKNYSILVGWEKSAVLL